MKRDKLIKWSLGVLIILFLLRVFVYQTYKIQSYEMASVVLQKDRLLISKLLSGSRFPTTILGLPGANKNYIDKLRIPYFRLPSLSKFHVHDVVAFNDPRLTDIPLDRKPLIISRIAGLPGDTIVVLEKNLYVNNSYVPPPKHVRREYRVVTDGSKISEEFIAKYALEEPEMIADIGIYDVYLDTIAFQAIAELPNVKQTRSMKMKVGDSSLGYWPYSSFFKWNRDQVAPHVIPYKGYTVDININNIDLYREIIENHEDRELLVDFRGVQINGFPADKYTFKKDYYYVMDDNRDNPMDSRIIGYIPKDHLLGKVKRILWSPKNKSFFKSLK